MKLVLASGSPRRREILTMLGIEFEVRVSQVDEVRHVGEEPVAYVERLSREKSHAVARAIGEVEACVLGADTVVVIDGAVLEKPRDLEEATAMIARLGGRTHEVLTGFTLSLPTRIVTEHVATRVTFRPIDAACARAYAASGEGLDKAGGYAVQGLGAGLVERIDGSYTNVVGLPASEVVAALVREGVIGAWP